MDSRDAAPRQTVGLVSMQDYAVDHLAFIRQTMERAGSFTAVSGKGQIAVGVVGVVAAMVASRQTDVRLWLATWLIAAVTALAAAATGIVVKSRALGTPVLSGPARRFALGFTPPLVAGAALTVAQFRSGDVASLPAVWLLLYGAAVLAGGALSVPPVPVMGACFMALGVAVLGTPPEWATLWLGLGFGVLHIGFGIWIAVKYGG